MSWVIDNHEMQHFVLDEFRCPCCYRKAMQPPALIAFDLVRDKAKIPMRVTSGFRCPAYNAKIDGKPSSAHLRGFAMDCLIRSSADRFRILEAALSVGISRIGIGEDFIHLDVDPSLPQAVVWTYG